MFYTYPSKAVSDNWLHDALVHAVRTVLRAIDQGRTMPAWPNAIPPAARAKLAKRAELETPFAALATELERLPSNARDRVAKALHEQNQIEELLTLKQHCISLESLSASVRRPVADLFEAAFKFLTPCGLRDTQYRIIYESGPRVCPFCGCEHFDAPDMRREALDHYLSRKAYAFAAANLRNLVPMCGKCNSRYKRTKDMLRGKGGRRRKSYYPYGALFGGVSLLQSTPFGGTRPNLPNWRIDLFGNREETATWESVFEIKKRLRFNVLDSNYEGWLAMFGGWCKEAAPASLIELVGRYAGWLESDGFNDHAFLKAAAFRMLERHLSAGDVRLAAVLRAVPGVP